MLAATRKQIKNLLPKRNKSANKTSGGKCLIIAGSDLMPGAAILAGKAAARIGAGYVYLCTGAESASVPPDFILVRPDKKINFAKFQAVAIGPGLGATPGAEKKMRKWLLELKKSSHQNVVVDADALNFLARHPKLLPLPASWVATPHAGELSRILGLKKSMGPEDRKKYLAKGQNILGCHLLLKGSPTYLFDGKKEKIIKTGNKALAKAGTGDVLTGMTAGLMAQGKSAADAALLAATLHGALADQWVKSRDYLSMTASDLIEMLPQLLLRLRK